MLVEIENNKALKTMYENLKILRRAHQWSLRELSERSGVDLAELEAAERGEDFGADTLAALCRLYRVRLSGIFVPLNPEDVKQPAD